MLPTDSGTACSYTGNTGSSVFPGGNYTIPISGPTGYIGSWNFSCTNNAGVGTWSPGTPVCTYIDLVASSTSPRAAKVNVPATLTANITNNGATTTGATSFPNIIQVALADTNGVVNTASIVDLVVNKSNVGAGATVSISATYTFTQARMYYVRACADKPSAASSVSAITESVDGNNCGAWTPIAAILPPANLRATCDAITKVISVNGDGYPDMGGIDYQLRVNDHTANATFQFTQTSGVCSPTINNGDWCLDSVASSPLLYANVAPFNVTGVNTDFYEIWAHSLYGGVLSDATTTPDWIQCGTFCPAMTTQTWKTNCGAPLPAGSSGERISIANTRAGYTGKGEYACQNGTWIPESSAVSTCTASASADLVASKIAPTEVRLNKTLAFQSVIQNIGGANIAANFSNKLEITRGLDSDRNATTTTTISTLTMSGLAMGEKKVFSTDYAFTATGIYYIRACADSAFYVSESSESNNCSPWQVISVTSNSGSSGTLTLSDTSCVIPINQYACNVTATWSTAGTSYPRLVTRDSATTTGNILSTTASNATPFTLTAEYNYTNFDLMDFSTTLDTKMVTTSCISGSQWDGTKCAGPNLIASGVTPISAMAATPTTFTATTTNNGQLATPSSFRLFFQVATAANGGGTISRIGTTTIAALAVGASAAGSKAYTFATDGTYSVRACADKIDENDVIGQINESNEMDNCGAWTTVTVTSNCVPQAVNWGSCTASVSSTVLNGATTAVTDSGAPYTGSATYLCTNGILGIQSGSTCVGRYTVTPSAGTNGTISPNTPQSVIIGNNAVFTVTPSAGYSATVGGTCGGSLVGTTYTTNAINADCTVDATFFMPPPATPTGFSVSPSTCNNFWLNLSWNASPTATSYSIYNSAGTLIQTTASLAVSINGTSNTSYSYYVKANNAGGQSAKTSTLSATVSGVCTYVCTGTAPTGSGYTTRPATTADGIWNYAASGECTWSCNNYYTQSGNSCSANTCSTASMSNATLCSGDSASVPVAGLTSTVVDSCTATKCEFKCDAGYNVSGGVCVVTPPVTPTGFGAGASSCGNYWINLWWNRVSGATSYDVYRDGGFLINVVDPAAGTTVAISDPGTSGVEYSYYVVAKNSGGLSSPTATAKATVSGVCPCSSQSKTWGGGCSASTGSTVDGATTANLNNSASGFVGNATFSCNGNTNTYTYSSGSCTATYTMTPSAGANGTISPNTPQSVLAGDTQVFTVTPTSGYAASVAGTCGGTLVGNTYTTNPASKNCTVVASFAVGVCPGPLTQTKTFTCDINANGYAAISGSVTRSQSKSAYPTCAFPSTLVDMTGANSSYVSDDCVYPTFTVTPSAGANGTISPNTPQTVNAGNTKVFTLAPTAGYTPAVTGTCGGTLTGNTYTTSPITANCTVIASFIPPTGTLTLPASCTIAAGASTCTVVATWVTANVTSPKLIDNNVTATLSTLASSTGFTVWVARPSTSFSLNDGTILLDGPKIVTAECASGSSWNGASNKCEAPSGTLSVSTTTCYMPVGIGSCNVNLTWTTTAPIGLSAVTRNNPAGTVFTGNNGTASTTSVSGSYPSTSYYLYNNAVQIAPTVTVTPRCAAGLYWDTGTAKCSTCGFTGCTGNGGSVSTPLGNLVCVNGRVPPTCLPVPEASISADPLKVSYQGTTTLTWTSLYSDTCIAGGPWSIGTATSGSGLSNGLLTDSTFTFQCIGPGGTSTLASILVSACPSTAPVLNKSSVCQQRPEASLSLISGNYTPHGKLTLGCQRAESYQLYRQDTVSSAKEAVVGQGGNFGGGSFTSTIDISTSGLYTLECSYVSKDGITFSSFNGSYINYQTKPPDPIVYLYQAPASIPKGSATTISWVVMYPNSVQESRTRACTLTAKPVCTNACSTQQIEAADKINDIIETEKTDLADPKGSRPITATLSARPWGGALNIIPGYDPSDPTFVDDGDTDWKATGQKTFNLDKTTDFKLDCGMPGKNASSTVRVLVTSTTPG
jgi:hypothetical protein